MGKQEIRRLGIRRLGNARLSYSHLMYSPERDEITDFDRLSTFRKLFVLHEYMTSNPRKAHSEKVHRGTSSGGCACESRWGR